MGAVRFGVPRNLVLWARDAVGARVFVETGTNRAETTAWAADHFAQVVSIEGMQDLYAAAVDAHGHRTNISFRHGDSRTVLGDVLADLSEPAILWLDAHWCGDGTFGPAAECPLLEELDSVNRSHAGHVILIDDARLFLAPPPAPHRAEDWPDLLRITAALSASPVPRYVALHDDVIVAIPAVHRGGLVEFLRMATPAAPAPRGLREIVGRFLRRAGLR